MIISTSKEDKKINLWDERNGDILSSFEDKSIKTYIPNSKILILGVYSEYIIALEENQSVFLIWRTDTAQAIIKCSPIQDKVTVVKVSSNSLYLFAGTEIGKIYVYELFSGNLLTCFQPHLDRINCLEVNYDTSVIITSSNDMIKLFLIEK